MTTTSLAGLEVRVVGAGTATDRTPVTVLLHGFDMHADDLAPFAASMGLPGLFLFPNGPLAVAPPDRSRRAWWMIDTARRDQAIARGELRDLAAEFPPGLASARVGLEALLDEVRARWPGRPLLLGGFSQGAILSVDLALRTLSRPDGLVLLSSGRVTWSAWRPLLPRLLGIPVFQSHGRQDRELSFLAAEALRDDLLAAGARVTWVPFAGGHEIPLQVLRELKKFMRGFLC